ncbi:MAG: energy transducer TonB [Deltaproteobacteria bacterium]|nr:energy transducer TonB [Deltaproteobacteria bacterium]
MSSLKTPFILSVLFHGIALFSLAVFYQPAKKAFMNIAPLEFIHLHQEEKGVQQRPKQAAITKKAEAVQPSKMEEKVATETPHVDHAPLPVVQQEAAASIKANDVEEDSNAKNNFSDNDKTGAGNESNLFEAMVKSRIEKAKFYPRWARQRGYEGVVGVQFVIKPDGNVIGVKVVRPCHCDILNKAACEAIMKAAPFSPRPKEMENKEMAMDINIGFRLE